MCTCNTAMCYLYILNFILFVFIKERVNFLFETLFETGVDENSWDDTVRTSPHVHYSCKLFSRK